MSVGLCLALLVKSVSDAKTTEPIEILLGVWTPGAQGTT